MQLIEPRDADEKDDAVGGWVDESFRTSDGILGEAHAHHRFSELSRLALF